MCGISEAYNWSRNLELRVSPTFARLKPLDVDLGPNVAFTYFSPPQHLHTQVWNDVLPDEGHVRCHRWPLDEGLTGGQACGDVHKHREPGQRPGGEGAACSSKHLLYGFVLLEV